MNNKQFILEVNGSVAKASYESLYSYERVGCLVSESFCEDSTSKELREAIDNLIKIIIEENSLK